MLARFPYWCARLFLPILMLTLISGCGPSPINVALGISTTPTADPTLLAVSDMLTQTAAAPTPAPSITPTSPRASAPAAKQGASIPQTGSQEAPASPGEPLQTGPYALVVLPANAVPAVGTHKASKDRAFLDVEVILKNTSSEPISYAALFFHLVDPAQPKADQQPLPLNTPKTPALLSGELAPGDMVRGHLFFDVPASTGDAPNYLTSFDPRGNARSAVWVDLSLPEVTSALPIPPSRDALPGLGKRVQRSGEALTVQSISARQSYGRFKPASGDLFIELDVTIENVNLTAVSYNADYLRVKDAHGYEYPSIVIPDETLLLAGSLTEGRDVSGHVIFEVPVDVRGLIVTYQPLIIGQSLEPLKVQVELPTIH